MELLLNLAWLLLALPAFWLWRGSLQCLLALACMLVILFPVVSATDDLHAMRAEMEESPAGKRTVRQASSDKAFTWKWQSPPALLGAIKSLVLNDEGWRPVPRLCLSVPAMSAIERAGRAPPATHPLPA
jgi:hypothetical protein